MKIFIIIVIVGVALFVLFQIYTTMSTNKTETQPYTVIRKEKEFEIRYYPAATMAMITSSSKSYRELGSSGFTKLANYIFGGNFEKKQIAMTSPVHMSLGDSTSTMAFVMPSNYNASNVPKPNDQGVSIVTSEPEYVAVIQFSGFSSAENIEEHRLALEKALKEKGLNYYGNFRYLGYNPPYQMLGRRNEVIVSVEQ